MMGKVSITVITYLLKCPNTCKALLHQSKIVLHMLKCFIFPVSDSGGLSEPKKREEPTICTRCGAPAGLGHMCPGSISII